MSEAAEGSWQRLLGGKMSASDDLAMEHAWRYFALHAEQRTTVFNFFTAAAGLTLTGLAYVLATKSAQREFGVVAGVGAMLLAFVFWKLDQRVAQLTKCAEQVLIEIEGRVLPDQQRTFALADRLPVNGTLSPFSGTWSYGRAFRTLFLSVAALGLIGASISAYGLLMKPGGKSVAPVRRVQADTSTEGTPQQTMQQGDSGAPPAAKVPPAPALKSSSKVTAASSER